jgi:deazaflavin-dependent oxidoreductase (nitroreductase family)
VLSRLKTKARAVILVPIVVLTVLAAFLMAGYLLTVAFRIPPKLNFPLFIRSIGALTLLSGALFFRWLFNYRRPADILISTYVTFMKARRKVDLRERSGRTEPLVVRGPYRYVRHPLYSGVVLLLVGWWLLLDYSFLLISTILLLLWFNYVVAPFEEKELRAIFGEEYEKYATEVPRIIPFVKRTTARPKRSHGSRPPTPPNRLVRALYALGFGPLVGRLILLLITTGRKTNLRRVTPLQYEEIDGAIYVASSRGEKADWFRNLVADPRVEVRVKSDRFCGICETATDPKRIADFLELRLMRHPKMMGRIFDWEGLPAEMSRAQLEEYAAKLALVIIHPESRAN